MKTLRAPLKLQLVSSGRNSSRQDPARAIGDSESDWNTDLLTTTADDDLLAYVTGTLDVDTEKQVRGRLNVDLRYRAALDAVAQRLKGSINFPSLISAVSRSGDDDVQPFPSLVVDWRRSRLRLRNRLSPEQSTQGTIRSSTNWVESNDQLILSGNGLVVSAESVKRPSNCLQLQIFSVEPTAGLADVLIEGLDGNKRYIQVAQFEPFEVHELENPRVIYVFLGDRKYQIGVNDLKADVGNGIVPHAYKTQGF